MRGLVPRRSAGEPRVWRDLRVLPGPTTELESIHMTAPSACSETSWRPTRSLQEVHAGPGPVGARVRGDEGHRVRDLNELREQLERRRWRLRPAGLGARIREEHLQRAGRLRRPRLVARRAERLLRWLRWQRGLVDVDDHAPKSGSFAPTAMWQPCGDLLPIGAQGSATRTGRGAGRRRGDEERGRARERERERERRKEREGERGQRQGRVSGFAASSAVVLCACLSFCVLA